MTTVKVEESGFVAAAASGQLALTILYSPDVDLCDRVIPLTSPLCIGRRGATEADLQVDDRRVSRRHLTVVPVTQPLGAEIQDHASSNGTFVNRQRREDGRLGVGAIIRAGDTLFELTTTAPPTFEPSPLVITRSAHMLELLGRLHPAAQSLANILLLGETGTGKELVARDIHSRSQRTGPFVAINCAAIVKDLVESTLFGHKKGAFTGATADRVGLFAEAEGGTLFLDEVGDMPYDIQAKLLRVLETREFTPVGGQNVEHANVRIVAATNARLYAATIAGTFRSDLYARLAGYLIELPPLRARRGDILLLARHFVRTFAPHHSGEWSANFCEALICYDWPLNVRELRNVMQRISLTIGDDTDIRTQHLNEALEGRVEQPEPSTEALANDEAPPRRELVALLISSDGNVSKLAEHYGKHRKQIYRWLASCQLDAADFRR